MSSRKEMIIVIPEERIERKIFVIRNNKVMIDRDLANLYQVTTKVLNQAVKRNMQRFPEDFMFQLTQNEKEELVTNCDHLKELKFSPVLPYAFTQNGVAMLSSILNSDRAVQVNIQIMRTFTKIKEVLLSHEELRRRIENIERKLGEHDEDIQAVFDAIKRLIEPPKKPRKEIGFHTSMEIKQTNVQLKTQR